MSAIILFVDNDASVTEHLTDKFRRKCDVRHVDSYQAAQDMLAGDEEVAVVVADLDVGGGDGIVFLTKARLSSPDTVRMVYSARDAFADALNALNTGRVLRYIKKPCPAEEMTRFLVRGVQFHQESVKERKAMRRSLVGSVKALVDILDLVNPEAMGLSRRIRKGVLETGRAMGVKPLWRLELAVILSHIGCVTLPGEILEKMEEGRKLTPEEQSMFSMHPRIAADLLANIDQMGDVAEIVRRQRMGLHDGQPVEARIIKVALDLDRLVHKGGDPSEMLRRMRKKESTYDIEVVDAMLGVTTSNGDSSVVELPVEELEAGMVLADDLVNKDGSKLLLRGQSISKASLVRLQSFQEALGIIHPVSILTGGESVKGGAEKDASNGGTGGKQGG